MGYIKRFFPLFLIAALFSCGDKIEPGYTEKAYPVVKNVKVEETHMELMPQIYEAVGTVRAGVSGKLASKVMGNVESVKVREGDKVKKGQLLVVIDSRQMRAQLDKALAGLSEAKKGLNSAFSAMEEAKAAEALASATYKRYIQLRDRGSVSDQEFDEIKARYVRAQAAVRRSAAMVEAAKARVGQARAGVASARIALGDTRVTAPYRGVVSAKLVDEGDLVAPGTPLMVIDTTQSYRVDVIVPESYASKVMKGNKVRVSIPPIGAENIMAEIYAVAPSTDTASRSFLVKARLPSGFAYKSGMFARVYLPLNPVLALLIPKSAVVSVGQLTGVFVVKDSVAYFRLVRLGKTVGEKVEILSGLKKGQVYVVKPPVNLVDGAKVEVGA